MKMHLTFLLALLVLISLTSGAAAEAAPYINPEFNEQEMKTIRGKTVVFDDPQGMIGYPDYGFLFVAPPHLNGWDETGHLQIDFKEHSVSYFYIPEALMDEFIALMEVTDKAQFFEGLSAIHAQSVYAFGVLRVNPALDYSDENAKDISEKFQHVEELLKNGEDTIYLCYNTEFPADLSQQDLDNLKAYVEEGKKLIKEELIVFPPTQLGEPDAQSVRLVGGAQALTATDMEGTGFGPADLAKYKLTLVNIWYTWCGPCVAELPDLQRLYKNLPEGVNLITICMDGGAEKELAQAILLEAGASFQTLIGEELQEKALASVYAVPTTIFLDQEGKQVGEAVVGTFAHGASFLEDSLKIIKDRLDMLGD